MQTRKKVRMLPSLRVPSARTPAEVVVVFFNKCDEMTITNSIKLASQIDFGEHKKNFSK